MNDECNCKYCLEKVNAYFCSKCFYNFNECESYYNFNGGHLCPLCHPLENMKMEEKFKSL